MPETSKDPGRGSDANQPVFHPSRNRPTYQLHPPEAISDPVQLAIREHGDQARSDEVELGNLTLTLGVRNVYLRAGTNHVAALPVAWSEASLTAKEPKDATGDGGKAPSVGA